MYGAHIFDKIHLNLIVKPLKNYPKDNYPKNLIIHSILTLSGYLFYSYATKLILIKINYQSQKFI